jgi:hypothetical protein
MILPKVFQNILSHDTHVTQEYGKRFYFVNIPKDELVIYMVIVKWRHTAYAYGV